MTSKVESLIREWVSLGLISSEQARRIREHEESKPESSWILSGLLALGALIIAIGVISVIAANWEQIPDAVKLVVDFALLSALAYAALRTWNQKRPIVFEVLLLAFVSHCLASIGLISQIFHTGGHFYQACLLWAVLTFPASAAAKQRFVPLLWTGGFLFGLTGTALESPIFANVFHSNQEAVLFGATLLCTVLTIAGRSFGAESATTRAFRAWSIFVGLGTLLSVELHDSTAERSRLFLSSYIPGQALALATGFGILLSHEYRRIQKVFLLVTLVLFLILPMLPVFNVKEAVVYAALTISILGLFAIFLASIKLRGLFQIFLLLIGMRFLILYFQALGGLAMTGIGLILSGALVIGMAALWNKYRRPIAAWAERWAH